MGDGVPGLDAEGTPAGTSDGRLPELVKPLVGQAEELRIGFTSGLIGLTGGLTFGGEPHAMRAA